MFDHSNVFNKLVQTARVKWPLLLLALMPSNAFAWPNDRPLISYFTDNLVFETIYNGGWYSVLIISILSIISVFSKGFREVFLSFVLAVFGLFLVILLYESYQDFQWLPPENVN